MAGKVPGAGQMPGARVIVLVVSCCWLLCVLLVLVGCVWEVVGCVFSELLP